ncbi:hypothetical protein [Sphingomonas sp. CFBP9021]|uniref:hypothetical protein n=1 Tax=Sphingomonas sp. CFBP9021 TaxID=3096534 RepID=UPI002A6AFD0A|nr:hypothetical protein [Sphingomonas sp. CFBP9021]MDY0969078.1 hypothetical protein [Sphingomonas sp. CFBP9021]
MKPLFETVEINRRFARSARLDADLKGTPPLVGYVMQASVTKALTTLADSQIESRQGAFTWTGPYGGGKSSAALLVANLVAGRPENRAIAREIAGSELTAVYSRAFPEADGPWAIVAVTGSRMSLRQSIADAAAPTLQWSKAAYSRAVATDDTLIDALMLAASNKRSGVFLILDELGKLLEHEASAGGDIHLLQDLAERSARSEGRLVVVGILHQAFDQYVARAARDARQEWAKVQGRYQDIPFLAGADETVTLLGSAITGAQPPASANEQALLVAAAIARRKPTDEGLLSTALAATWPLNPVTSLLLGPVSRQRFAQNERSVFGFLSSAEPFGFQEFLRSTSDVLSTYGPDSLWDYLSSNFGMALSHGSDGGRFSLAFEAIERAAAKGGPLHVRLTKAAAVIEFFRNGSGLALADDIFAAAVPNVAAADRIAAIADLVDWAVLIRQPRLGGYALFAGSDFDLEDAINRATSPLDFEQLASIPQRVGLGFATAKRHYFRTGALRTFEVVVQLLTREDTAADLATRLAARRSRGSGMLVLALSDGSLDVSEVDTRCKAIAKHLHKAGIVAAVASAANSHALRSSASELFAVERVFRDHPQLEGDRIARREMAARRSGSVDVLHRELEAALNRAKWWLASSPPKALRDPIAMVATALADSAYDLAPVLKSELLQRDKPSSSAMAAVRELGHAMVRNPHAADLGFEGFPAEMGLYLTVLKPFGIHGPDANGHIDFRDPQDIGDGPSLWPAWSILAEALEVSLADVYANWSRPPYGMKAGIMPVLALAILLANRDHLAVYLDGVFQTEFDDVFVDKLLQKPAEIRIKRVDRSTKEAAFLSDLARHFGLEGESSSLPVAQALFQRFKGLTVYAQRTDTLSADAKKVRSAVLKARDPEALLFEALPEALGERLTAQVVTGALDEAIEAYPKLLTHLEATLAKALAVDPNTFLGAQERAASIKDLTNDYAFEGFAMRAAAFERGEGDIEGVASVLLHKPAHGWSDRDREQALLEMARFGRQFRELEALAVVRDRRSNTEALALVIGVDPRTPPLLRSFVLTEPEKADAALLAEKVLKTLRKSDGLDRVRMAALARAVATLAADQDMEAA